MKQKNYVAYLRQSTVKQEISGLGVEAQRENMRIPYLLILNVL